MRNKIIKIVGIILPVLGILAIVYTDEIKEVAADYGIVKTEIQPSNERLVNNN
ncbi:hypothetical protein LVD15_26575 [Fulvivirga maritima]|uniref:hypothetical protein n=1 Tax=Fulvivirga maritima TaxID=2904247 RepID=UPI001F37485B|nr:hypothetical protein [Fulvivirga maritima]UII26816.1 hypothetical protein LVD15_26575 [Fulvivirga maritima]